VELPCSTKDQVANFKGRWRPDFAPETRQRLPDNKAAILSVASGLRASRPDHCTGL